MAAALAVAAITAGGTRFEAFVRVAGEGRFLLDARLDEPAVGRLINIPAATLGEAAFAKRSWVVASTYAFSLRIRPELAPGRAVQDLQVSVRLPGRVTSTNATRVAGGLAVWESVPARGLSLRTVAVHWVPLILLAVVAGFFAYRRRS